MLPMVLDLHVAKPDRRIVRLWLPLFLIWPLVVLLLALPLLVLALVDAVLFLVGQRYHHYTLLVLGALWLLADTRGMVMHFTDGDTAVDVTVY